MEPKNDDDAPKGGMQGYVSDGRRNRPHQKSDDRAPGRARRDQTERGARAPTGGEGAKGDGWGCRAVRRTRVAT